MNDNNISSVHMIRRTNYGVFIPREQSLSCLVKNTNRDDNGNIPMVKENWKKYEDQIKELINDINKLNTKKDKLKDKINTLKNEYPEIKKQARMRIAEELKKSRKRLRLINERMNKKEIMIEQEIENIKTETRKEWGKKIWGQGRIYQNLKQKINEMRIERDNQRQELENIIERQKKERCKIFEEKERWLEEMNIKKEKYTHLYPEPPKPSIVPTTYGSNIPLESGIYFFWNEDECVYVGQSINLNNRLRLHSHHRLKGTDMISFVSIPEKYLLWAECFYIGYLRPSRNVAKPAQNMCALMLEERSHAQKEI